MPRNRFDELVSILHFNNNTIAIPDGQDGYNRLHKIQPIIDHFRGKFTETVVPETHQAIDEMMIPFKGHHGAKMYSRVPNKRQALTNLKHDDPTLTRALKLGKRCLDGLDKEDTSSQPPIKVRFRQSGGGRKKSVPEVREAMYEWFIDIRSSLKARLPKSMFKAQCKIVYEQWLSQQEEEIPEEKKIVFSNKWIRGWMHEYNVSLRKPNKRFQIKQADREERIFEYIKNIWTVRKFFYR